jgi:hypothetical protein
LAPGTDATTHRHPAKVISTCANQKVSYLNILKNKNKNK